MLNNDNRDIYTLVILTVGTLWGAFVKYIAHIKNSKEDFSILILMSEFFAHGFAGFLSFFVCKSFGANDNITIGVSLVFAFTGLKVITKFEDELIEGLDEFSEWIKRRLK